MTTQEQIEQLKGTIATLESQGNDLIQSEINSMKDTLSILYAKLEEEIKNVPTDIKEEVQTVEVETIGFFARYRTELIVTVLIIASHVAGKFGF